MKSYYTVVFVDSYAIRLLKLEQRKKNKYLKLVYTLLKLSIAVLSFWFIYSEVLAKETFRNLFDEFFTLTDNPGKALIIFIIVILMFVNWALEAVKWKFMIRKIEVVSFLKAFGAIFSGLTVSFFTPNRVGEYAGRIFHLHTGNRIRGTLITIVENTSQLIITMVIGSASLFFFLKTYIPVPNYLLNIIGLLIMIFIVLIVLLFIELPRLDALLLRFRFMKRLEKYFQVISSYSKYDLFMLLLLAFCRYLIFSFQFYLILNLFEVTSNYSDAILLINMIFFAMTVIPTFALTELGVRGAVSGYFLSKISIDTIAILDSTISLWAINLVIPSLIGIPFILKFRFKE